MIEVEVGEDDPPDRLALGCQPVAERLLEAHLLAVHGAGQEARHGRLVGRVAHRALHAGIDEEGAALGVADGVEEGRRLADHGTAIAWQ